MIAAGVGSESGERCSDASRAAGESLHATASTVERWLLIEIAGSWPRDVSLPGPLPAGAHDAVAEWLAGTPRSRVLFVRRPGRRAAAPSVFAVRSHDVRREVRRIEVDRLEDLESVDLDEVGEVVETSLVLVCGHGSRDRCCSRAGTAVFAALAGVLGEDQLWLSSHQGGHRFAGNVLVLPSGLQLGRLGPEQVVRVTNGALAGRIDLGHYRGRTCYETRVQAAEHAIREATGLHGVDDLRLDDVEEATVRFQARNGELYSAVAEEIEGPLVPASCGTSPEPQMAFRTQVL